MSMPSEPGSSRWADLDEDLALLVFSRLYPKRDSAEAYVSDPCSGPANRAPAACTARLACKAWLKHVSRAAVRLAPVEKCRGMSLDKSAWLCRPGGESWLQRFSGVEELQINAMDRPAAFAFLRMAVKHDQAAAAAGFPALPCLKRLELKAHNHLLLHNSLPALLPDLRDHLVLLSLRSSKIKDEHLSNLGSLSRLTSLNLRGNKEVYLERKAGLTDAGLQNVSTLVSLTSLDISRNRDISSLEPLAGLTNLTDLSLSRCKGLRDASALLQIRPLAQKLKRLNLEASQMSGNLQSRLGDVFTALTDLNIVRTVYCSAENVLQLCKLKSLSKLALDVVDDQAVASLAEIGELCDLNVHSTVNVTSSAFADNVARCQSLTSLSTPCFLCLVNDDLAKLQPLTALRHLRLESTDANGAGVRSMGLHSLKSMSLNALDGIGVAEAVSELTALTELSIRASGIIGSDESMAALLQAVPASITKLSLIFSQHPWGSQAKRISEAGLGPLTRLQQLQHLCLDHSGVTPGALGVLTALGNLRMLNLHGCHKINDHAMHEATASALGTLTNLTSLVHQMSFDDDLSGEPDPIECRLPKLAVYYPGFPFLVDSSFSGLGRKSVDFHAYENGEDLLYCHALEELGSDQELADLDAPVEEGGLVQPDPEDLGGEGDVEPEMENAEDALDDAEDVNGAA